MVNDVLLPTLLVVALLLTLLIRLVGNFRWLVESVRGRDNGGPKGGESGKGGVPLTRFGKALVACVLVISVALFCLTAVLANGLFSESSLLEPARAGRDAMFLLMMSLVGFLGAAGGSAYVLRGHDVPRSAISLLLVIQLAATLGLVLCSR